MTLLYFRFVNFVQISKPLRQINFPHWQCKYMFKDHWKWNTSIRERNLHFCQISFDLYCRRYISTYELICVSASNFIICKTTVCWRYNCETDHCPLRSPIFPCLAVLGFHIFFAKFFFAFSPFPCTHKTDFSPKRYNKIEFSQLFWASATNTSG